MEPERERTDEDIAREVQAGGSESFGILMRRFEPKLLRYASRFLGDRDKAEEVVQETFIRAYQSIHTFNPGMRFSPWIYRIAHNQAVSELRRIERAPFHIDLDTLVAFSSEEKASDEAEREETRRMVETHLGQLSRTYREILVLFYLEELGYREIADVLRIPTSTVGVRLKRAREALKKIMPQSL